MFAISCVMEDAPKFRRQTLNWLATLHECGALTECKPHIHYLGEPPSDFLDTLGKFGAILVHIQPFGTGSAVYCNKLMQLATFRDSSFDAVLLSDTDIAFLESPGKFVTIGQIRAKIVDKPNPPADKLAELLARAGFAGEPIDAQPDFALASKTHRLNCNGGFYAIPGTMVHDLEETWMKWSRFCLEQADILGERAIHSDQLGFMLSLLDLGLPFSHLPATANYPAHFEAQSYQGQETGRIAALHYHHIMAEDGFLRMTGAAFIDKFVALANDRIRKFRSGLPGNSAVYLAES